MPLNLGELFENVAGLYFDAKGDDESSSDDEKNKPKSKKRSGPALNSDDEQSYAAKVEKAILADVRMISGCKDEQTSADVHQVSDLGWSDNSGGGGACTNAFLRSVNEGPTTWIGLLNRLRANLKKKHFKQIPQLSASRKFDLRTDFEVLPQNSKNHKALLIGINYVGQKAELGGCHNDVSQMKEYLLSQGFTDKKSTMKLLMDDGEHTDPTAANITKAFSWLVDDAEEGDTLFMHFSGHGGSIEDDNGDEKDGRDETIIPLDYLEVGQIRDDDIYKMLVTPLPPGVHFTILMDCCHSGSIIDLPYILNVDQKFNEAFESGEEVALEPNDDFSIKKILRAIRDLFINTFGSGDVPGSIGDNVKRLLGL